jgi:hypothetical protein
VVAIVIGKEIAFVKPTIILAACFLFSLHILAQKNEAAVTFGGMFTVGAKGSAICEAILTCPTNVDITLSPGFALNGSFSHRIADFKAAALSFELPLLATPSRGQGFLSDNFSTIYFTPSFRVQFAPSASISPFLSAGAGFGHFSGVGSDTRWATQFGGGLDFKTHLPHLGFRVEVRDYINGTPSIGNLSNITAGHMQQVYAGGGVVLRF